MASIKGLEGLKKKFPIFEFRNRSGSEARRINLTGGDSAQVQAGAAARLQSEHFDQLPSFQEFEPVIPSVEDMMAAGLLGAPETPTTEEVDDKPSKTEAASKQK